jgi:DNA-binding IclR family transcriptional regulator
MAQRMLDKAASTPGGPTAGRGSVVGAVQHAIEVMRVLSHADAPVGINEIARRVGLHKSSISRLISTLERERLVQRDAVTERISLGIGLVALAAPLLAKLEAKDVVRPLLEDLARRSGETVSYSVWDGSEAVTLDQALGVGAVRTYAAPGRRNPGHSTAAGKMLLSHQPADAVAAYCRRPLASFTIRTITDEAALQEELSAVRARGYALNEGEHESDVGAVSSAVHDRTGRVVGTVTATVPLYRFEQERRVRLVDMVVAAAAELSAKLGYAANGEDRRFR